MITIGLNVSHNTSGAILKDGKIIGAIAAERINGIKYFFERGDAKKAFSYIIKNFRPEKIDMVGMNYGAFIPQKAYWENNKLYLDYNYNGDVIKGRLFNHHLAHAASVYYTFKEKETCLIAIFDACGSYVPEKPYQFKPSNNLETISFFRGENNKIRLIKNFTLPYSIGEFYSMFTAYLGFNKHKYGEENIEFNEGKTMGLAPYGARFFRGESFIFLNKEGFSFNDDYIYIKDKHLHLTKKFFHDFGPPRTEIGEIKKHHMLVAYIVQNDLERIVKYLIEKMAFETGLNILMLAGGTFLNCVMNSKIINSDTFKRVYIYPASDDAGLAIGNAYLCYYT